MDTLYTSQEDLAKDALKQKFGMDKDDPYFDQWTLGGLAFDAGHLMSRYGPMLTSLLAKSPLGRGLGLAASVLPTVFAGSIAADNEDISYKKMRDSFYYNNPWIDELMNKPAPTRSIPSSDEALRELAEKMGRRIPRQLPREEERDPRPPWENPIYSIPDNINKKHK